MSKREKASSRVLFAILGILVCIVLGSNINTLFAKSNTQTGITESEFWSEPQNLSKSGAANEPRIVVDANDILHVLWREDPVNSFFYTQEENGTWRQPIAVNLPFGNNLSVSAAAPLYNPRLYADANGRIHAFWLGEKNGLYYSSVPADLFTDFVSWGEIQQVATSAVDFSVAVDNENNIHLSYIRDIENSDAYAGVYYRNMNGQDFIWSPAVPLYQSAYYRALSPNDANIDLAVMTLGTPSPQITETVTVTSSESISNVISGVHIFTAADNRPIEQVSTFYSDNGGINWDGPNIIDERRAEDGDLSSGPSKISVMTMGEEVHLIWLAGHETNCEQYHQWSADGGVTWEVPEIVPSEQLNCPEKYELFSNEDGLLLLLSFLNEQAFLQAWNGVEWSKPELQPPLTRFVDPITHRQVKLDCQQTAVIRDNQLVVTGCGSGAVNDVWVLERPLGDNSTWFPPQEELIWQKPEPLFESSEDRLNSPVLLPGSDGLLHSFWLGVSELDENAKIYYSQWNGESWTRPVPLLHLDIPNVDHLQGLIDGNGLIFLMWRNTETNEYFYREVDEQRVLFPADWSALQNFSKGEMVIDFPEIYSDESGHIGIVFAKPLNESRGIYFQELNGAELVPNLIFDAAEAGWEMVNEPHIVRTENQDFHIIMTRSELKPEPESISLHYLSSLDGGETWSEPISIAEGNILWSDIVSLANHVLLIVWQQNDGDQLRQFATQSIDNGLTWDRPNIVLNSEELTSQPNLTVDDFEQAHLLQMFVQDEEIVLQDRSWRDGIWDTIKSYSLANKQEGISLNGIAATSFLENELFATFIVDKELDTVDSVDGFISSHFVTNRQIDFQENETLPQFEVTPTVEPTPTQLPVPTEITEPLSDTEASFQEASPPLTETPSLPVVLILATIPVVILIGGVFLVKRIRKY
ncbi:MAG: hypothetical protein IAF02_17945 [Anaerolineae bacterium]|nr:hypothetical protein [Anaerolineae bacterium]